MPAERIRELERKGILNLFEGQELAVLREEESERLAVEEERRQALEKEREGKKAFILKYRRGNIFQDARDMEMVREEIWAKDAAEAAEIACTSMVSQERWNATGTSITDASSCRLDVFEGDQLRRHRPVWVNPYAIAPSQQVDGGPTAFAENAMRALTGRSVNISDGKIEFLSQ